MPFALAFLLLLMRSIDCGLHADCVKFVPGRDDLFVISCYEFDNGLRKGKLILANCEGRVLQEIGDISGVFDFSWIKPTIVVVAFADGEPKFFEFCREETQLKLLETTCSEEFCMTLAVTGRLDSLVTCDNRGQLRLCELAEADLRVVSEWTGHDSEIWYVADDAHDPNLFYSCADEGALRGWDRRALDAPSFTDKRTHEAGVCCAASNPHEEFIFATGSYDEKVRIWDRRSMKQPQRVIDCGSGAWRVVWNPEIEGEFGVAVMRKGFQIYNNEADEPISCLPTAEEAVAYGIDLKGSSVVSCTFYNNQAQIWSK